MITGKFNTKIGAVGKFFNALAWYPPAEARIPFATLIAAMRMRSMTFEREFSKFSGTEHCVFANSGRSLLTLLLRALKKKADPNRFEVVIPGYTCYSVAASVVRAGLSIKVYDLNPRTLVPDSESVKQAIGHRTLAIVAQHLFGIPTDISEIKNLGKGIGAVLIEDAAQGLGGSFKGHPLGTMGDFGIYSFGRGKPLPLGHGGALIGGDGITLEGIRLNAVRFEPLYLMTIALTQIMSSPRLYGFAEMLPLGLGRNVFDPSFPVSAMAPSVQRLGAICLPHLKGLNTHRRRIAKVYGEIIDEDGVIPVPPNSRAVLARFPVMAKSGGLSEKLVRFGVRRMYPRAICDEPAIKSHITTGQIPTPGASNIAEKLITLPTHTGITASFAREIALKAREAYQ